ncbi:MAG: hypothetical protein CMJ69_21355 [Planctomycetaceae bacterium]|nr:hypothetical protein [Planctomycetaceae bacterium]
MDTDRLGQMTRPLSRPVQGLTAGGWALVAALSGLVMLGGWAWMTRPTNDTDPWISVSVRRSPGDAGRAKTAAAATPQDISRTLDNAGIDEYRFRGNRLQVRASQVERTMTALERGSSSENKWTARWEEQVGKLGAFPTVRHYEQASQIALVKEIEQLLVETDEISEAHVLLARSRAARSFGARAGRVTATIGIKPRQGVKLTDDQIEILRQVVAGGVPDLHADDVVIFDQTALSDSPHDVVRPAVGPEETVARGQQPEAVTTPNLLPESSRFAGVILAVGLLALVPTLLLFRRRAETVDVLTREMMPSGEADEAAEEVFPETESTFPSPVDDSSADVEYGDSKIEVEHEPQAVVENVQANSELEESTGTLSFLANADPSLLAGWLTDEHPQMAAVIVSELPERFRTEVLDRLDGALKEDLVTRLDAGVDVHDEVLLGVAEQLRDRWRDAESSLVDEPVESSDSPGNSSQQGWSSNDVALLQAVEGILSQFEDLVDVEPVIIRSVYDLLGPLPFHQALSGSAGEVRHAILGRLDPLARMELVHRIDQQDPVRLSDIQRSQREILKHTRRLLAVADPKWKAERT